MLQLTALTHALFVLSKCLYGPVGLPSNRGDPARRLTLEEGPQKRFFNPVIPTQKFRALPYSRGLCLASHLPCILSIPNLATNLLYIKSRIPKNLLATLLVAETKFYFSCKQFATCCKERYEKLAHAPTVIQVVGDSSARDTFFPYKWDQRKNYKL